MARQSIDDLGDLQRAVMEVVWDRGEATVRDVRQTLGRKRELAYTTVLSVLQRLEKAGWLRHRREGRNYVYLPKRSRSQAGSSSLRGFINRVFDGDPMRLFQHLIDDDRFDEADLHELKTMIERAREERRDA